MSKKKPRPRPFDPKALKSFASPLLYPRIGTGAPVWRYTVVVPIEQIRPTQKQVATLQDLESIERLLIEDFGGITTPPSSPGYGLRDAAAPDREPEMNFNTYFVVYAAPVRESDNYFQALREELEDTLDEGVILIEKQQIYIV